MFDKTKERIRKLEETNETFRNVKQHLQDNKKVYFVGAGFLGVGFVGGKYFQRPIIIDFQPVINNRPVFNNHNIGNVVQTNIGRVSKIVRDVETGEEWQKIRYLAEKIAEENGISYDSARVMLGKHFRGTLDRVFDKKYELAGLRTEFA